MSTAPPRIRRRLLAWGLGAAALLAALIAGATLAGQWLMRTTPGAHDVQRVAAQRPSHIVSADGVLLDRVSARVHEPVALDAVAPVLVQALLATEDQRFHTHRGVDWRRLVAAAWHTLRGERQGGSTLTQQLARNLFPQQIGQERTLLRKLRETAVALKIEAALSKDQILALYLNQVPFLYDVSGVEMAARTYFGKPAARLDLHEAALLVAMLKGPAQYDPLRAPQRARERRDLVLALMQAQGRIPPAEAEAARAAPLGVTLVRQDGPPPHAPHYVREVRRQLAAWAAARGLDPARDGLVVHATLDTRLQTLAEDAVRRQADLLQAVADQEWSASSMRVGLPAAGAVRSEAAFAHFWRQQPELLAELVRATPAYARARAAGEPEAQALRAGLGDAALRELQARKTRLEAGFVALDPRDGAVRAYVGSRDWALDQFDHVAQARRQPGSTFKPFVYGAALVSGIAAEQTYLDAPVQVALADGRVWAPGDVGGASGQALTLRDGLARSKNSITVQVAQQVGVERVVRFARAMGIERAPLDPVPSLALGTSPVTLLEMARAYATLATLGIKREPQLIARITDRDGRELARFTDPRGERVLDETSALALVDMMRDAVTRGTGTLLRQRFGVRADIAGKTGTTQRHADGWFLAMRPGLVAGAWVGFNDPRVVMRSGRAGQGGRSALLLVGDFLAHAGAAGLIDMQARFPPGPPPLPPIALPQALDDGLRLPDDEAPLVGPATAPALRSLVGAPAPVRELLVLGDGRAGAPMLVAADAPAPE
jgi:penicillin-binding protein 1A